MSHSSKLPPTVYATADLPANPRSGDAVFDSDLGILKYWDGSQWSEVGKLGSVVAGTNVTIDNTDPINPIISAAGGGGGGGTVQNVNLSIEPTDEGTTAGNARGANAVDLQTDRNAATQVASGNYSVIGGGSRNMSVESYNTIGGGYANTASGLYGIGNATVSGGAQNTASAPWSTVSGGAVNTSSAYYSVVGGGMGNNATQFWSTISGGYGNTASAMYSSILGGSQNTASGTYSAVLGGQSNNISGSYTKAMIVGSNITADRTNCTFVSNLSIKSIPTSSAGLPAGSVWNNGGVLNIV